MIVLYFYEDLTLKVIGDVLDVTEAASPSSTPRRSCACAGVSVESSRISSVEDDGHAEGTAERNRDEDESSGVEVEVLADSVRQALEIASGALKLDVSGLDYDILQKGRAASLEWATTLSRSGQGIENPRRLQRC